MPSMSGWEFEHHFEDPREYHYSESRTRVTWLESLVGLPDEVRASPRFVETILRHRPSLYLELTAEERSFPSDPAVAVLAAARAMATGYAVYSEVPQSVRWSAQPPHAGFILASIGCCYSPGYDNQAEDYKLIPEALRAHKAPYYPSAGLLDALRRFRLGVVLVDDKPKQGSGMTRCEHTRGTLPWRQCSWIQCPRCDCAIDSDRAMAMIHVREGCDGCTAYDAMHRGLRHALETGWSPEHALAVVFTAPWLLVGGGFLGDKLSRDCVGDSDEDAHRNCASVYSSVPRAYVPAIDRRTLNAFTTDVFIIVDACNMARCYDNIPAHYSIRKDFLFHQGLTQRYGAWAIGLMPMQYQKMESLVRVAFSDVRSLAKLVRLVAAFSENAWPPTNSDIPRYSSWGGLLRSPAIFGLLNMKRYLKTVEEDAAAGGDEAMLIRTFLARTDKHPFVYQHLSDKRRSQVIACLRRFVARHCPDETPQPMLLFRTHKPM